MKKKKAVKGAAKKASGKTARSAARVSAKEIKNAGRKAAKKAASGGRTCTFCQKPGHNRRTCPGAVG